MSTQERPCPDCEREVEVPRRDFLKTVAVTGAALATGGIAGSLRADEGAAKPSAESLVARLYGTLNDAQRKEICFAWDHQDKDRGLLRTRVSNNWHITKPIIASDFYTKDQQEMIRAIFDSIYHPDWHARILKQLQDDAGGYGKAQNIAIFGDPGAKDGKFEFVMTGRHMTVRCDGNTTDHVAFGGPLFYGHAASSFNEKPGHPHNVYWRQGVAANEVFAMLDGKQRERALVADSPSEEEVAFQGKEGKFPGLRVADMSADQKGEMQRVLRTLVEPYRQSDRDEIVQSLKAQGGLDACSLAFYKDSDYDKDGVWDNWRLEGPAFVWYFRGEPHVHVWVNVASDPSVKLNA